MFGFRHFFINFLSESLTTLRAKRLSTITWQITFLYLLLMPDKGFVENLFYPSIAIYLLSPRIA